MIVHQIINSGMKQFTEALQNKLSKELETIALDAVSVKERCTLSIPAIDRTMQELRIFMAAYQFKDPQDEILYYKKVIPALHSEYIYYARLLDVETRMPEAGRRDYLRNERKVLTRFFRRNAALYQYHKMGATTLDEQYYSRKAVRSELAFDEYSPVIDSRFTTVKGFKLAQLMAYEKLLQHLQEQRCHKAAALPAATPGSKVTFTGPKMWLVELLYASFYTACFNDGKIEIKELAQAFEQAFNIRLGNYYRSKQELYTRKNSAAFLDTLRKSLLKGLEDTDGTFNPS